MSGSIEGELEGEEPNAPGVENVMIPQVAAPLSMPSVELNRLSILSSLFNSGKAYEPG